MSAESEEDDYRILSRKIVDSARSKAGSKWPHIASKLTEALNDCHCDHDARINYAGSKEFLINRSELIRALQKHYIQVETREIANQMADNIVKNYSDERVEDWNSGE